MPEDTYISLIPITHALPFDPSNEIIREVGKALSFIALDPEESHFEWNNGGFEQSMLVYILEKISFELFLIPGATISIGKKDEFPSIKFSVKTTGLGTQIAIEDLEIVLHLPKNYAQQYKPDDNDQSKFEIPKDEDEKEIEGVKVRFIAGFVGNTAGFIDFHVKTRLGEAGEVISKDEVNGFSFPPIRIGDTEFLVEGKGFELITYLPPQHLMDKVPAGFKGLWLNEAYFYWTKKDGDKLFKDITLSLQNAAIGEGGFTGTVALGEPKDAKANKKAEELDGLWNSGNSGKELALAKGLLLIKISDFKAVIQYFGLSFLQSIPSASRLAGYLYMDFAQKWLRLEASINGPKGEIMMQLGGTEGEGLFEIKHELLEIFAESMSYELKEQVHYVYIKGSVKPKIGGLDWPKLKVNKFGISSDGHIDFDGGWVDMPEALTLDFKGFKISLTQFGLGTEKKKVGEADKEYQWLGVSGGIALSDKLSIGASVEGLKFTWPKEPGTGGVEVSLKGIGVDFTIPKTLSFTGSLKYERIEPKDDSKMEGDLFTGKIKLALIPLRLDMNADLMVGKLRNAETGQEFTVFYIFIDIGLPTPIVLGATGLGLYGLAGLAGINVAPTKGAEEAWYEWYKRGADDKQKYSVTHIKKWKPQFDEYAFGAGIKLGTAFDDGFTFNMKLLLAVLIPGPVIMLEGKGNLLTMRNDDEKQSEGAFYTLIVFDGRVGTFQMNVDVKYDLAGIVVIGGGMEAFFDFNDASKWYLHIGKKEPAEKRIRMEVLKLFKASSYVMVDPKGIQFGFTTGYDFKETYGPVSVKLVALLELDAGIFWDPGFVEGRIRMLLELGIHVFGIGLGLMAEALLEGKADNPWYLHGKLHMSLDLPWPLPDPGFTIDFTWGTDGKKVFTGKKVINEAYIQHPLSNRNWPLVASKNETLPENAAEIIVVPVDCLPVIKVNRPFVYKTTVGAVSTESTFFENTTETLDGHTYKSIIENVVLSKWEKGAWVTVKEGINTGSAQTFEWDKAYSILNQNPAIGDPEPNEPIIKLWQCYPNEGMSYYQFQDALALPLGNTGRTLCQEEELEEFTVVHWYDEPLHAEYPLNFLHKTLQFASLGACTVASSIHFTEGILNSSVHNNTHKKLRFDTQIQVTFPETTYKVRIRIFPDKDKTPSSVNLNAFEIDVLKRGVKTAVSVLKSYDLRGYILFDIPLSQGFDGLIIRKIVASPPSPQQIGAGLAFLDSISYNTIVKITKSSVSQTALDKAVTPGDPSDLGDQPNRPLVLQPDSFYRLHLSVAMTMDGNAHNILPTEIPEKPGDPGEQNKYYFFRTDSGPGLRNDLLKGGELPYADDPCNQFRTYLAATTPVEGARAHYYGYALTLLFNQPQRYIRDLWGEKELRIVIKDRKGEEAGKGMNVMRTIDAHIAPILLDGRLTSWLRARAEGRPEEAVSGCSQGEDLLAPLFGFIPGGLKPNRLYQASFFMGTPGEEEIPASAIPVFEFPFTTSRFRTFTEHVESACKKSNGQVVQDAQERREMIVKTIQMVLGKTDAVSSVTTGFTKEEITNLQTAQSQIRNAAVRLNAPPGRSTLLQRSDHVRAIAEARIRAREEGEETTYSKLYEIVKPALDSIQFESFPTPENLELIQILYGDTSILLLNSPEPIEWDKVSATLRHPSLGTSDAPVVFLCDEDGRRAFITVSTSGEPAAALKKDNYFYTLTLEYDGGTTTGKDLAISGTNEGFTKVEETIECKFVLDGEGPEEAVAMASTSSLLRSTVLTSPNRLHTLSFTPEGNLQLFNSNRLVWESRTANLGATRLEMAANGNLAIMGDTHQILWQSGTVGTAFAGSQLYLQDDGNLALRNAANKVVWETATRNGHVPRERLLPGESLLPGQSLWSNNRQYRLTYQTEGNLAFYRLRDQQLLWSSGTTPPNPGRASMEKSGDIVIYSGDNLPIWRTNLNVQSPIVHNRLEIADTGLVQIMRYDGVPVDSLDKTPATAVSDIRFTAFKHTVSGASSNNWTAKESILDHAALNGQPNAKVFIMADWGPASGGLGNDHPLFVEYGNGRWRIVNGDGGAMSAGYHFNVLVVPEHCPHAFVHEAAWNTLQQNRTYLDHPACNGKPDARLLVTAASKDNRMRPIGVSYDQLRSRWFIFNAVQSANEANDRENHGIAQGSRFHVLALNAENAYNMEAFVHQASADNIIPAGSHLSFMDYPGINTNTSALIFATHLWEGGDMKTINPAMSMLWYDAPNDSWRYKDGYWSVINTGIPVRPMYDGVKFQVMVFKPQPSGS